MNLLKTSEAMVCKYHAFQQKFPLYNINFIKIFCIISFLALSATIRARFFKFLKETILKFAKTWIFGGAKITVMQSWGTSRRDQKSFQQ